MAKEYIIGNVMGPRGEQGPQGVSVTNVEINEDGHLIVTLSNGNSIDAGDASGPVGAEGPAGKSASRRRAGILPGFRRASPAVKQTWGRTRAADSTPVSCWRVPAFVVNCIIPSHQFFFRAIQILVV